MDKYKELYDHSKDVFKEELNRFKRIDIKATQYLTVLTLLIGAAGYFGKWLIDYVIPPNTFLDWSLLLIGILILFSLIVGWYLNFVVLKLQNLLKIPLNDETIEFYSNNKLIDIYFAMSKGFKESLNHNRKITNKKAKYLAYGYKSIIVSVSFLVLFTSLFLVKKWDNNNSINNQKENTKMSQNDKKENQTTDDTTDQSKPANEEKPDPKVKPPKFELVQEAYDPKKLTKRDNSVNTNKKDTEVDSSQVDSSKKEK